MVENLSEWRAILNSRKKIVLLIGGILFVLSGLIVNNTVSTYVDSVAGASVGDLILDNIPAYPITFLFFWVTLMFWISMIIYHVIKPRELGFLLWGLGLLIFVRCFFISLTHLGPPENNLVIPEWLTYYSFNADLFFSGHVGAPFILALLVENKWIKRLTLVYVLIMIFVVLFAHGHYSIDIFASLFIAHSLSVLLLKIRPFFGETKIKRS